MRVRIRILRDVELRVITGTYILLGTALFQPASLFIVSVVFYFLTISSLFLCDAAPPKEQTFTVMKIDALQNRLYNMVMPHGENRYFLDLYPQLRLRFPDLLDTLKGPILVNINIDLTTANLE